jgi:hypothetical protein
MPYELFMEHCDIVQADDTDSSLLPERLQNYSLKPIRHAGFNGCGFSHDIPSIQVCNTTWSGREWVFYDHTRRPGRTTTTVFSGFEKKQVCDLLKLYLKKSTSKARAKVFKNDPHAKVHEANGSVESIMEWAVAAGLDAKQRRSFEAIIASFILTFHNFEEDDYNDPTISGGLRVRAKHPKKSIDPDWYTRM